MGYELKGTIIKMFETKQVSERFTKREFVVETNDNPKYPQPIMLQITGDRISQLDSLAVGDDVRVEFSLRGRAWNGNDGTKYFNSIDCWKVERIGAAKGGAVHADPDGAVPAVSQDEIPFATCSMSAEPSPIARVLRR